MRSFANISALILVVCGLLRAAAEVIGGVWEGDADYLIYQAQLMLDGKSLLPWVQEFDDKLPIAYIFFLPSALLMSVRAYQLMIVAGLVISGILLVQICREILNSAWSTQGKTVGAISLLAGSIYLYMQTMLPSSITTINVLSAIFFVIAILSSSLSTQTKIHCALPFDSNGCFIYSCVNFPPTLHACSRHSCWSMDSTS